MSKVLVTGGAGFLGSHIADVLTERGYEVVIFDRKPSPYLGPDQTMVVGDILQRDAVDEALDGCDYVFHLAALADLNDAKERPVDTARLNVLGTVHLLEAASQADIKRFVFASTVYVYSRAGSFYRASKQACEAYIEEFQRAYGLSYTVLRYGSLYGPRSDASNGVYRLLLQAVTDGVVEHTGTPEDAREYIHVRDAARLSADALADEYENQHLILTGHHTTRLRDLFTMFAEILGRPIDVNYRGTGKPGHDSHYRVTPYAFNPRTGYKLTSNYYVDMGQGVLQLLEQIYAEGRFPTPENGANHA